MITRDGRVPAAPGSREPSPSVSASGFDPSRGPLLDWLEARWRWRQDGANVARSLGDAECEAMAVGMSQECFNIFQALSEIAPKKPRLADIADLPEAVRNQLSIVRNELFAEQVLSVMDGPTSLDHILIRLWRRHRVQRPRRFVMNKLYRMYLAGLVAPVGAKGVYTPLKASAIEAASAGETRSGSTEGESAAPSGETPR